MLHDMAQLEMLSEDDENRIGHLVRRLQARPNWSDRFTDKFVNDTLVDVIREIGDKGLDVTEASERYEQVIAELDCFSHERVVYTPLIGVSAPPAPVKLGNVQIRSLDAALLEEIFERFA